MSVSLTKLVKSAIYHLNDHAHAEASRYGNLGEIPCACGGEGCDNRYAFALETSDTHATLHLRGVTPIEAPSASAAPEIHEAWRATYNELHRNHPHVYADRDDNGYAVLVTTYRHAVPLSDDLGEVASELVFTGMDELFATLREIDEPAVAARTQFRSAVLSYGFRVLTGCKVQYHATSTRVTFTAHGRRDEVTLLEGLMDESVDLAFASDYARHSYTEHGEDPHLSATWEYTIISSTAAPVEA